MRWNCPHCGTHLAISDEKLGAGWSFSRCYKCAGFALVRKAEVNLVKVDRAPAGEHILLPEATEVPGNMMNEQAMQNLERFRFANAEKNAARAAMTRAQQAIQNSIAPGKTLPQFPPRVLQQPEPTPQNSSEINAVPEPLPELPTQSNLSKKKKGFRVLNSAIGVAGAMTVASGGYLFFQGRALYESARAPSVSESARPRYRDVAARGTEVVPAPAIVATAVAQSPQVHETSDQISQSAMAPLRAPEALPAPQAPMPQGSLVVRSRLKKVNLHSGPGIHFPIVAKAGQEQEYLVTNWNDHWFGVVPKEPLTKQGSTQPKIAWVRADMVQAVPPNH